MSKSITIQEGGVGKNLTSIKKIQTAKQGGGTVYWVPEDEVELTTKHITKNGTYKASKDGAYGYSQVTVSGIGKATGIKPGSGTPIEQGGNGNDNEYNVGTDEQTGELKEILLPSSIKIEGLPTKTEYTDGEPINKAGMVVKAYLADGTLYDYEKYQSGGIPLSELDIEPTIANKSTNEQQVEESPVLPDSALPIKISSNGVSYVESRRSRVSVYGNYERVACYISPSDPLGRFYFVFSSKNPFTAYWSNSDSGEEPSSWHEMEAQTISRYEEKTAFYTSLSASTGENLISNIPTNDLSKYSDSLMAGIAWSMLYGKITGSEKNEVTVKWERPEDGKELTDTFEITVNPAPQENNNESGGGGGSW